MTNDELWQKTLVHLNEGNFTALEQVLGGPDAFDCQIIEWHRGGKFDDEPEALAEALSCACMLGRITTAEYLLDLGVDPYAGMKTWLAGPHWAASSGHPEIIKLLIERGTSLEIENKYGGTVLGQALWSAVNEHKPTHAEIIEMLIQAGAEVESGTAEWWQEQDVPSNETKQRVAEVLGRHAEFHSRLRSAKDEVFEAESTGSRRRLADSLKALGNLLRRPPFLRSAANDAYRRAADLYLELELPLEAAWVIRHIGINYEYAERLTDAEKCYDESLEFFRKYAASDDRNYANTVRYPAVIKNRVGKRDDSRVLWEEAVSRYDAMQEHLGVAEGAAWLTFFALDIGDKALALEWFAKAEAAAEKAGDQDTDNWIAEVKLRLDEAMKDRDGINS